MYMHISDYDHFARSIRNFYDKRDGGILMNKKLKSLFALCLAFLLLLPGIYPVSAKGADGGLSVCIASDIHYRPASALNPIQEENTVPGDALYHHANNKSMLTYEADGILDEFFARVEKSDAEFLLIPGDLSEDGFPEEHLAIAEKLRDFQNRTGKTVFLIPGNHDIRTSASRNRLDLSDFLEIYADLGFDKALVRHEGSASYTAELNADYRLLAIDACVYRQDTSKISDELYSWIEEQLMQAKTDGRKVIAMVHHNVLKHFELESVGGTQLCLDRNGDVACLLADHGVKVVLTGHEHANDISTAVSAKGNRIYDIETCSLITYPNAYRMIRFSDEAVDIKTDFIDRIDTSLLPDGFSAEQLKLLEEDFTAYSHAYFRAGLKSFTYYIPNYTSKVAKTLKVEAGTKGYEAIGCVMDVLAEALRMPIYDKAGTPEIDSVSELAAAAHVSLPASEYTDVIDVAAVLYANHLRGDESFGFDSDETALLIAGLEAVLVYALVNAPAEAANALLADILPAGRLPDSPGCLTTVTARLFYIKTASKMILHEILRPLAAGITEDYSAPADLNVTLEPYGAETSVKGQTDAVTPLAMIIKLRKIIIDVFLNTLKSFGKAFTRSFSRQC